MIDFAPSDEQRALRDAVTRLGRDLSKGARERDREAAFPREHWRRAAELGLAGLPVPREHGGSGLDAVSTALALEAFGAACTDGGLVFSLVAHLVSCVVPLWRYGSDAQRERWLPGLCDGSLVGVHAMTEPDSGSDAFAMRSRAVRDGDGWRLTGTKTFVTNAPVADVVLVFAMTDPAKGAHGGASAFLVPQGAPGLAAGPPFETLGLRTSPLGELRLDGVRVGDDALVGGVGGGARVFATAMDWERVCLFAAQVGAMERLLETAVAHARTRRQGGQTIGRHQAVGHKVADMKVHLEAARLLVYKAAWSLDRGRGATLDASIAKLFASESLVRAALDTVQIHGGAGVLADTEVERALRDAVGSTLYSGTSEIQRNLIARWLGL